jgi:hypothetical protein
MLVDRQVDWGSDGCDDAADKGRLRPRMEVWRC